MHKLYLRVVPEGVYFAFELLKLLRSNLQLTDKPHSLLMTLDTAMNTFNSSQFKIRKKKMAAQVNFYLYLNVFLSPELFGA